METRSQNYKPVNQSQKLERRILLTKSQILKRDLLLTVSFFGLLILFKPFNLSVLDIEGIRELVNGHDTTSNIKPMNR